MEVGTTAGIKSMEEVLDFMKAYEENAKARVFIP
jgi:hypothetical protein